MTNKQTIPYIKAFGVKLSKYSMEETVNYIFSPCERASPLIREDLNAFKVILKDNDVNVSNALRDADIINIDGMSVVFAVRILYGQTLPRVTGCDLFTRLLHECHERSKTVFLLGATEQTIFQLHKSLSNKYSKNLVAGFRNGYFSPTDWDIIVRSINDSNADFLFLGTPSPQKEIFLNFAKNKLNKKMVLIGVGGSFDVLAGKVSRAPAWMQNAGLEWLYRLIQEPNRMWKRYLITNTKFSWLLLKEKFLQFISK